MAAYRAQRTHARQQEQGDSPGSEAVESAPVLKYVNSSSLNLRELPSHSGRVLTAVPAASRVEALETRGGWHRVRVPEQVGYMSAAYLVDLQEDVRSASAQARSAFPYRAAAAGGGSRATTLGCLALHLV